jgi:ketosteroid isomerase-like protein
MSEENVEVARQAVAAFLEAVMERDRTAFLAVHDQDVELVPIRDGPKPGVRGAEAAWDFYRETFGDRFPIGDVESVDAGGDNALLHYRMALSEIGIGAGITVQYWNLATIRQGKIVREQWFADRAEALEAAGLSE